MKFIKSLFRFIFATVYIFMFLCTVYFILAVFMPYEVANALDMMKNILS